MIRVSSHGCRHPATRFSPGEAPGGLKPKFVRCGRPQVVLAFTAFAVVVLLFFVALMFFGSGNYEHLY